MKLLFCGAFQYGNLGDDGYKRVIGNYFHHTGTEVLFDSPYPDLDAVAWADAVLIGPGGLIYDLPNNPHFDYMEAYLREAEFQRKPFGFFGVGIQLFAHQPPYVADAVPHPLQRWVPWMQKAGLVTVRSPECARVLRSLGVDAIQVFPDLNYLLTPSTYKVIRPKPVVFVPSAPFNGAAREIFEQTPSDRLCLLSMSTEDDAVVLQYAREARLNQNVMDRRHCSPEEAVRILKDAEQVVTQRYHGLVFARSGKPPHPAVLRSGETWKLRHEPDGPAWPEDALGHFQALEAWLS